MKKITLKDIQVLNEAVELLSAALPHTRHSTLAPLVQETRDKLVENYRAQALAETEAAPASTVTPELLFVIGVGSRPVVEFSPFSVYYTPESGVFSKVSYNVETREAILYFRNGRVWSYLNVPKTIFDRLLHGDYDAEKHTWSIGKAYNRLLKNKAQYEPARVVDGKRTQQDFTVHYSFLMEGLGMRFDKAVQVKAESPCKAVQKVKAESGKQGNGGFQLLSVRPGRWIKELGTGKFVEVGS